MVKGLKGLTKKYLDEGQETSWAGLDKIHETPMTKAEREDLLEKYDL